MCEGERRKGGGGREKKKTPARYYWGIDIFTKFLKNFISTSKKIFFKILSQWKIFFFDFLNITVY